MVYLNQSHSVSASSVLLQVPMNDHLPKVRKNRSGKVELRSLSAPKRSMCHEADALSQWRATRLQRRVQNGAFQT